MGWVILSKPGCPSCVNAKRKLDAIGDAYTEVIHDTEEKIEAFKAAGHRTFPRVYRDGELIGGYEDLLEYLKRDDDNF